MKISYPEIPLAQIVVQHCALKKIKHIVICAGSRNAPLTNGFTNNPFFEPYSIVDERSAAFFALGMAQQKKHPVALVCTSGSALLNFYPAIAEAYYSDVPLVVLSADRMPHRINIGDGQTIEQRGAFQPHLEAEANLKPDVAHATETILENPMQELLPPKVSKKTLVVLQKKINEHNIKEVNETLTIAKLKKGPVHLNIPMEEPLYGMTEEAMEIVASSYTTLAEEQVDFKKIRKEWFLSKKKWIIIGVLPPDELARTSLDLICKDPSVAVFTEVTSNTKHSHAINSIDTLMAPIASYDNKLLAQLSPEILLSFGGMVVSKKIKTFLRKFRPNQHWHVGTKKAYNTYYSLSEHFKTHPQDFLEQLYDQDPYPKTNYKEQIMGYYNDFLTSGKTYLKECTFSDLKAFETIFENLPNTLQLQLSNSSTIRYAQLFDIPNGIEVFCNRGTSGIDGSTSTAIGAGVVSKKPTLLITGDLSFFYDSNAFWNHYIPSNFRIILINNNGGGIFRILPGAKDSPQYDRYFETVHNRNAKLTAKEWGFDYLKATSHKSLKKQLKKFFKPSSSPKLLEIQTPRKINDTALLGYFEWMAKMNTFAKNEDQ